MSPARWINRFIRFNRDRYKKRDLDNLRFAIVDIEKDEAISISLKELKEFIK